MTDPSRASESRTVSYEPVAVKDLLVEMKDTAELLVDLSYSAVLHNSRSLAQEVVALEAHMDVLQLRAWMSLLMAARSPDDAEALAPVVGIVGATEKISDATGDVAKVVLDDVGVPDAMRGAIPEAVEPIVRGVVADGPDTGRTLGGIDLETETGVRVVAIRRDREWLLDPGRDDVLRAGDVVLLRGPEATIPDVYERLTGDAYERPSVPPSEIADLDRAVDSIVLMRTMSELAVDLAYGSILFSDDELANEVRNLEVEVDALRERFEAWALQAAAAASDPVALRGLLHIGVSTEVISDAALEMAEAVLRDIDVHPVVEFAVEESTELISRVAIEAASRLDGSELVDGVPDVDVGTSVIAVRRPDEGWYVTPEASLELRAGDVLITKGTRGAADSFRKLATAPE